MFQLQPQLVPAPILMLCAPLVRCAAERWTATRLSSDGGPLSARQLAEAFTEAVELCDKARRWRQVARSPIAFAVFAARAAGWNFRNATTLWMPPPYREQSILQLFGPVLRKLYVEAFLAQAVRVM